MKKIKYILPLVFILFAASCEKTFPLEETNRGKLLIGKWKYQSSGYLSDAAGFIKTSSPCIEYEIELKRKAKISINSDGEVSKFRIRTYREMVYSGYGEWKYKLDYGKKKEEMHYVIHYCSMDSILVELYPHNVLSPSSFKGVNVFKRVE